MSTHNDSYKSKAAWRKERQDHVRRENEKALPEAEQRWREQTGRWVKALIRDAAERGLIHCDTDTAVFTRSLAAVLAAPYDRRYPALMARSLMPPSPVIDAGADSVLIRGHQIHGAATVSQNYDTEVRRATISGQEDAVPVYSIRDKWYMAWQQVRSASMSGVDINGKGLAAARQIVETELDRILSLGYIDGAGTVRMRGLVQPAPLLGQNPVGTLATLAFQAAVNPAGSIGLWPGGVTTAAQIINDVALLMGIMEANEIYTGTELVLAPAEWNTLNSMPVGIVANMTVKQWLEGTWGFNVHRWYRLTNVPAAYTVANAARNRVLIYEKSPQIIEPLISVDLENLPSAWDGAGWSTQVHTRTAGVHTENPLGFIAFDMS
jgi:hypothetical protein